MILCTEVKVPDSPLQLTHSDSVMLVGSCFTSEIGERLNQCGFDTYLNPFGILYNPLSIAECLNKTALREHFTAEDLVFSNEYWYCFSAHGDYRGSTQEECLKKINSAIDSAHEFLKRTKVIVLTLGSAWTYYYRPQERLMGNCHKIDGKLIDRRMQSVDSIVSALNESMALIRETISKDIRFLFTISPIRHWKEGYRDNMLSKSTLHLSVDRLCSEPYSYYFPSYEIVMDEERDYRYYAQDMLHLNETGVGIIWEKFQKAHMNDREQQLNKDFYRLCTMQNHRPLNPDSEAYRKHLIRTEELRTTLQKLTPKQL